MKYSISIYSIVCIVILTLTSCDSRKIKVNQAFENIKEIKIQSSDSLGNDTTILIINPIKKSMDKKNKCISKMDQFKYEIEKQININKITIKEIKSKPNSIFIKQAIKLENSNDELLLNLVQFEKDENEKWEKFKIVTKHNIEKVTQELNEIKK